MTHVRFQFALIALTTLSLLAGPQIGQAVIFSETFDTDVPNETTFNTVYPAFTTSGDAVRVVGGVVENEGTSNITVPGVNDDIVIKADVSAEQSDGSYNVGLVIGGNNLVFHPGFTSTPGAFRVEGSGGFSNTDMGFVPPNGTLHQMEVVQLHDTGEYRIKVTDGSNSSNVFTATFTNPASVGGVIGFRRDGGTSFAGLYDNLQIDFAAKLTADPAVNGVINVGGALPGQTTVTSDALTLQNTGITDSGLDIQSFTITGPDSALFDVPDFVATELVAGGADTVMYDVSFGPATGFGTFTAELTLMTNIGDFTFDLLASVIPEPSSFALLGLGLCGLMRQRKRRLARS